MIADASINKKSTVKKLLDEVNGTKGVTPAQKKKKRKCEDVYLELHKIVTPLLISPDTTQAYSEYNGESPTALLPFNECLRSTEYSKTIHFYIHDRRFTRILRNPDKYIEPLSKFASVIAPDFSVKVGMREEDLKYSIAASRAVANFYYNNGVSIIPNVQWCLQDLYDLCFSGIPKNSTVAVNCTGIIGRDASKYLWLKGYKEMLKRLNPVCIIRYGDKMPGEDEDRSIYFANERLVRLRGGAYGR